MMGDKVVPFSPPRGDKDRAARMAEEAANEAADVAAMLATIEHSDVVAAEPPEPTEWEIAGMLQLDDAPCCLFGLPSAGKSLLANDYCLAAVLGRPFLGRTVRQRPSALYINLDSGAKTFRNRIRRSGGAPGYDFIRIRPREWSAPLFRALLEKYRGGAIVIDCLARIYHPDKTQDPGWDIATYVEGLRDVFEEFSCGGFILDHARRGMKGEPIAFYGSVQKMAMFRTMWAVSKEPSTPGTQKHRILIHCEKQNEAEDFADLHVVVDFSGKHVVLSVGEAPDVTTTIDPALLGSVETWANARGTVPFSKQNAKDAVGKRAAKVGPVVDALVESGRFVQVDKKSGNPLLIHTNHVYAYSHRTHSGNGSDENTDLRPVTHSGNGSTPQGSTQAGTVRHPFPPKGMGMGDSLPASTHSGNGSGTGRNGSSGRAEALPPQACVPPSTHQNSDSCVADSDLADYAKTVLPE